MGVEEIEIQSGPCPVERDWLKEAKAVKKWAEVGGLLATQATVMHWPKLQSNPMSVSKVLQQPWSVFMCVASVTNGLKYRTVHNWTHHLLTEILKRACLTHHWLQHLRDWFLSCSWADDSGGKLSLRVWECESWSCPPPHHVIMWWQEQGKIAPPLTTFVFRESQPTPLPTASLRRAGTVPRLDNTVELPCWRGHSWAATKNVSFGELVLPLICYKVAWSRGRCLPQSSPSMTSGRGGRDILKTGELAQHFNKSQEYEQQRASPTIVCHSVCWLGKGGFAWPLLLAAGVRAGPWVMRVEGQDLPLTVCRIQESRPCTLPGQNNSALPAGSGAREPVLRPREQENQPYPLLLTAYTQ